MNVTSYIKYLGVNDRKIDLFEGMYKVENGMAYNSYAILDEKIAILDTVDQNFVDEWLSNIEKELNGSTPDFLIIQHMEPDHSSGITKFAEKYPSAVIVSSAKSFNMMKNYFGQDYEGKRVTVAENSTLSLGKHELKFITAPMVHWPEVIVTYDSYDKVLFSADAFGKFGTLDTDEDWACEARRYYFGIVGKYGVQVQALLKKVATLPVDCICPLHGPILSDNLSHYINLYNIWSNYDVESEGVMIAYTSVYGHTKKAVELLKTQLETNGCKKVVVCDLAREDMAESVEDAFKYGKLVLATTTYNGDIFPFMREFITNLTERNYQKRKIGFIENGTWAPIATKIMKAMFEKSKNIEFAETNVSILSNINENNIIQINELAKELI